MNRILVALLVVLLALSIGLNAGLLLKRGAGQPERGPRSELPPPRRNGPEASPEAFIDEHLAGMSAHLGLDSEQREAIRALLAEHMPEMIALRGRAEEAHRRISEAFAAPEFDADAFARRVEEAGRARDRADSLSALMLRSEAALLTPAQRIKFAEVAPTIYVDPRRNPPPRRPEPPRR